MKGLFIFFLFLISSISFLQSNVAIAEPLTKSTNNILILKSKDSNYYDQTIQIIRNTLPSNYSLTIANIKDNPPPKTKRLIITLGSNAAKFSRNNYPNNNKIFSFLTLQQSKDIGINKNEAHLLIEQSPQLYFKFAKILLPEKTIGILFQKWQNTFLSDFKDEAVFIEVGESSNVIIATRWALKNTGLLLAIPNKNIYNRHSLKGILLSAYQNATPLISYSPAHVKAGALAAIYASPANLAKKIVASIKSSDLPSNDFNSRQFAEFYTFKINRRVAQSLGLKLISATKIARMLEKQPSHE